MGRRTTVMKINRRAFLKLSGAAAGTFIMGGLGFDLSPAEAYARELRIKGAKETTTICCYCSVGCGILVHTKEGKVINTEGDPEHPISEGSLCSKGGSLSQIVNNENRLRKPLYRAPGSAAWKEVEWGWALDQIARKIKDTRDRTFKTTIRTMIREKKVDDTPDEAGLFRETVVDVEREFVVNRAEGIAHVGSAALDNEECYLIQKLVRSWGLVYVEHQARL
jgi:formate dehydrogenase major subunit